MISLHLQRQGRSDAFATEFDLEVCELFTFLMLYVLHLKVVGSCNYSSFAGGMPISREISCDHSSKYNFAIARLIASRLMTSSRLVIKFYVYFAYDQLNSADHRAVLEASSSVSCLHILTECICSCTYMDTLPLNMRKCCFLRWQGAGT